MKPIIVPVDFTANSANAARYAADLALAIHSNLYLVYIFRPPFSAAEIPLPESVYEELREDGLNLLNDLSDQLIIRTKYQLRVFTHMVTGGIESGLEAFCREHDPLLVVIGASGHSTQRLHYPVLVIPENAAWRPVRTIVVACDKEDIDGGIPEVLPFLRVLNGLLGARLEVLHVIRGGADNASDAIAEYDVWKGDVAALAPELHFVRKTSVPCGVNDYLSSHEADWLMVLPKSHCLLEFHASRAKQIVLATSIPVVSLHE